MKKILLALCLTVLAMGSMFAQKDSTANKPVIKFEKTEYDFGTIAKGSNGTFELSYTNEGIEPLIVSNVQKTCGCTNTDWTKEPVLKGKKGSIKITYDTNRVGQFQKTVYVYSNAKNASITITFKGTVTDGPAQAPSAIETTK